MSSVHSTRHFAGLCVKTFILFYGHHSQRSSRVSTSCYGLYTKWRYNGNVRSANRMPNNSPWERRDAPRNTSGLID